MAGLLAEHYTVITYDRRGFSRSPIQRPSRGGWAETHAQDAQRLLDVVAGGPAHVFGSSAGAVIGLERAGHGRTTVRHRPRSDRPDARKRACHPDRGGADAPGYHPDLAVLDALHTRIVPAAGRGSRAHFPYRPAAALAVRWNQRVVEFPGDHTGYWSRPDEFAAALAGVLAA